MTRYSSDVKTPEHLVETTQNYIEWLAHSWSIDHPEHDIFAQDRNLWHVNVNIHANVRHNTSYYKHSKRFIKLNLNLGDIDTDFNEYASFANDAVIGSVKWIDHASRFKLLVAHEYSHYIQHQFYAHDDDYKRSHGVGFKTIYRYFRRLINPQLKALPKAKCIKRTANTVTFKHPNSNKEITKGFQKESEAIIFYSRYCVPNEPNTPCK